MYIRKTLPSMCRAGGKNRRMSAKEQAVNVYGKVYRGVVKKAFLAFFTAPFFRQRSLHGVGSTVQASSYAEDKREHVLQIDFSKTVVDPVKQKEYLFSAFIIGLVVTYHKLRRGIYFQLFFEYPPDASASFYRACCSSYPRLS